MRVPISAIASSALSPSAARRPSPVSPMSVPRSASRAQSSPIRAPDKAAQKPLLEPHQNDLMGLISVKSGFRHVYRRRASPFSMPTRRCPRLPLVVGRRRGLCGGLAGRRARRCARCTASRSAPAAPPFRMRHPMEAVYSVIGGGGTVRDPDTGAAEALVEGSMIHVEPGTAYVCRGRRRPASSWSAAPAPPTPRSTAASLGRAERSAALAIRVFHRDKPDRMLPIISRDARLIVWPGVGAMTANMNYVRHGAGRGQRPAHPRRVRGHDLHPRRHGDASRISTTGQAPVPCGPGDPCSDRRQACGDGRPGRRGGLDRRAVPGRLPHAQGGRRLAEGRC